MKIFTLIMLSTNQKWRFFTEPRQCLKPIARIIDGRLAFRVQRREQGRRQAELASPPPPTFRRLTRREYERTMQDLLGLDGAHRMNTPGVADGNWTWRFDWSDVPDTLASELLERAVRYGRW